MTTYIIYPKKSTFELLIKSENVSNSITNFTTLIGKSKKKADKICLTNRL